MFILRINFPDYVAETVLEDARTAEMCAFHARVQYGPDNVSIQEVAK